MKLQPAMNYVLKDSTGKDLTGKEWMDYVVACGYQAVEIPTQRLPEQEEQQDEMITYAKEKGLKVSLHAPFGKNNITDTDEENRKASIMRLKKAIDLAAKHQLKSVTFHPGRLSSEEENPEEKWEMLLKIVAEVAAYAKEKKVYVGIENMEKRKNELVYTIEDLNRFAEFGKDNPYFGVTLDFAHFSSHNILEPDLSALKLPVHNVHLSQGVDGKMHFPLTVQNGMVDVQKVCKVLKNYRYEGFVVFETGGDHVENKRILEAAMGNL